MRAERRPLNKPASLALSGSSGRSVSAVTESGGSIGLPAGPPRNTAITASTSGRSSAHSALAGH
jgi:hypothetical protein